MLIGLHHHTSARVCVIFEWLAALFGICFATLSELNNPTTTKIELIIFLGMGLAMVMLWNKVVENLTTPALCMLLIGGAAYILGEFECSCM
jgi:channel protein (hemolysin III family)